MGKGARWGANNKICGTCANWGGSRDVNPTGQQAIMKADLGKCILRGGPKWNYELSDGNKCNKMQKWGALR